MKSLPFPTYKSSKALIIIFCAQFFLANGFNPMLSAAQEGPDTPIQRIGKDDLLSISVYQLPELSRDVRVDGDGYIKLPMLDHPLKVQGLFPSEVEASLANDLRTEDIMIEPVVNITIAEYHSRPVSVTGAVKRPLTFQAFGTVTLLDAIAKAEGLTPEAGSEVLITNDDSSRLIQRVAIEQLITKADARANITLVGGENIRVPESGKVYVVGSVKRPGVFRMQQTGDTTVLKLLALSEGLLPFSSNTAYIYRRESSGSKNEIAVPLHDIVVRKTPDVGLQPDDVFYVPDNKNRRLTMTALDRIATFGAGTVSGVLIWR